MTAYTAAGTTLGISASLPASFDATGFNAVTHTAIGEITDIGGTIGRVYNLVSHNPIGSRATVKKKGSYNSGSVTVAVALDTADAGQVIANAALLSDNNYSIKLTYPNGGIVYFQAVVLSFTVTPGSVDSIVTASLSLEITAQSNGNDFVRV